MRCAPKKKFPRARLAMSQYTLSDIISEYPKIKLWVRKNSNVDIGVGSLFLFSRISSALSCSMGFAIS